MTAEDIAKQLHTDFMNASGESNPFEYWALAIKNHKKAHGEVAVEAALELWVQQRVQHRARG